MRIIILNGFFRASIICIALNLLGILLLSKVCKGTVVNDSFAYNEPSDTTISELQLDTLSFLIMGARSVNESRSDTLIIQLEGKTYRVPYKVFLSGRNLAINEAKNFTIRGLGLKDYPKFSRMISKLFKEPWKYIRHDDVGKDSYYDFNEWRSSNNYDRFFRQYDKYRNVPVEQFDQEAEDDVYDTPGYSTVSSNVEIDFPLPESIDLDVDLRNSPRLLSVLGMKFNFDKLEPDLQIFLLTFDDKKGKSGNKTILSN